MKNKKFKRIYIEITNVCNLSCSFCPETSRISRFMTVQEFEKILEKVKEYTDYIYLHVKGEPLLHVELDKILDKCEDYKMKVNITTNGSLLEKNKEMLINKKAIRQINISLHSSKDNLSSIIESSKFTTENSNIIIQFRIWNLKGNIINTDVNESIELIEKIFKKTEIMESITKNNNIKITNRVFLSLGNEFTWPDIRLPIISKEGTCLALKQQIAILVDGTVVPCCLDNNGDIILGNIFDESMEDILKSKKVENMIKGFRENVLKEELCQKCGFIHKTNP